MTRFVMTVGVLALTSSLAAQTPAASADRTEIVAVVQAFFDSMAKRDAALATKALMPDARIYAVTEAATRSVRPSTAADFIRGLTTGTGDLLERMWDPEIRIQGGIATLWTRYDFHRGPTFSHCGTDAFDLVNTADGWKIAGLMYTVERTGCAPSPLGPPK
jgi:hypothetical protein